MSIFTFCKELNGGKMISENKTRRFRDVIIRKEALMTIYNIRNSKKFFSRLSECRGAVEIVGDDGRTVEYSGNRSEAAENEFNCFDGTIKQIELKFHNVEDLEQMLGYIMNERRSA